MKMKNKKIKNRHQQAVTCVTGPLTYTFWANSRNSRNSYGQAFHGPNKKN